MYNMGQRGDTFLENIGAERGQRIPTEGVTEIQSQMTVSVSPEYQAAQVLERYPNIPEDWDYETIISAGYHLDHLLSANPLPFVADIWATFNAQPDPQQYAATVRSLIYDSIPPEYFQTLFNLLDLSHVDFLIRNLFPETMDYLTFRWVAGPDNQLETWVNMMVTNVENLMNAGDEETAQAWRNNTLIALDTHRPDFLKNIPTKLQARFLQAITPQLLDAIDQANISDTLANENTKTIMMFVGGTIAVVGAVALFGAAAKPKRKTPAPAPVIITK